MTHEDHSSRSTTIRRFTVLGLLAIVFVGVLLAALALRRDDDVGVAAPIGTQPSAKASSTITTLSTRTEVIGRLNEILGIRDKAFRDRNAKLLEDIYTVDCPCLEGDRNAIDELLINNYHMVGGTTSIRVHRANKVNTRLWLVIADFRSTPLRIESEDDKLIREETGGSDLFQFALSKPAGSDEWLLGRATAYEGSSG